MKSYILILILEYYINCNEIIIDPATGHNGINCLLNKIPCKDFSYVFTKGVSYLNDTTVILNKSMYNISSHTEVKFVKNLIIESLNATLKCTGKRNGITFIASKIIQIKNLTIKNCGARHISTEKSRKSTNSWKQPYTYVALYFLYCQNISIQYSNFIRNKGRALSFYNVNKLIYVAHTVFKNNTNKNFMTKADKFISGGGIYIEYTLCNTTEKYSCHDFPNYNKDTLIKISHSIFEDNTAENRYGKKEAMTKIILFNFYQTFARGAGICVNMFAYAMANNVIIDSCVFRRNKANWGGGLSVTFKDVSDKNSLFISNSKFFKNNATYAGGGARMETLFNESFHRKKVNFTSGNFVSLINLTYVENSAILGGGMSYLGSTRTVFIHNSTSRDIIINKNKFFSNTATIGYALGLNTINNNQDLIGPGLSIRTNIADTKFINNHFIATEDSKVVGQGALYSDQFTLVFSGTNILLKNHPTAVVLDSSSLLFSRGSITFFHGNYGVRGGALAMYGLSWLTFGLQSAVLFHSNWVTDQGGAIYVEPGLAPRLSFQTTWLCTKQCFFRYEYDLYPDKWPVNITFDRNYSLQNCSGNSIYALTTKNCRINEGSRLDRKALDWKPFKFKNNPNSQSEIVTSAVEMKLNKGLFKPYPNLPYSPAVTIFDEKNQTAYATLELNIVGSDDLHIFHAKDSIPKLRITEKVYDNFTYQFRSVNGLLFESKSSNGSMRQCPPGYRPNDEGNSCICMDSENGDVLKCFEENTTVLILNKKWGYLDKDNLLKLIPCPLHFCKCNVKLDLYKCALNLSNQCIKNRNGTLCGICNEGYSVKFGVEGCVRCGNTSLYIMILFILIGIPIFVVFLLIFNCDAISGHLDAYLFSNQMFSIIFEETVGLDPVIGFVIGITSFTGTGGVYGICLYDGMNNIAKLGLNYVLPISIIVFTWVIAKIAPAGLWQLSFSCRNSASNDDNNSNNRNYRNNNNNRERRSRNFGRALSFVSVLCYSSITNTSFRILRYIEIKNVYYVYNAPGTIYFSYPHNILFVVACILVLFISVGFPFMLCFEEKLVDFLFIFHRYPLL